MPHAKNCFSNYKIKIFGEQTTVANLYKEAKEFDIPEEMITDFFITYLIIETFRKRKEEKNNATKKEKN